MDNDGDLDVVACVHGWRENPGIVEWYENDGFTPPNFLRHIIDDTLTDPHNITPVDLDNDDDTDLLVLGGAIFAGDNEKIVYY